MEQGMNSAGVDKKPTLNINQGSDINDRRKRDRRRHVCKGFTRISTVGWICRREAVRRKKDPNKFLINC